ncbi:MULTISPECIES: hypothetical protein [Photobacterium]|jgi:hypothetical protein|uniref:Uncharacterized protein n=1 Tax=Photobacterium carnosum TaxID=2023717 RepID=A0A2N4UPQ8_9GAMM|nr:MULTISPECIES: hypothetical protein [Photobacterium]MBY3788982.1 hypothetical protein [Photobacterium carnosum]MCD9463346.1 hypothetical protein [Photobacterium phosphoreum]MCD9480141.1 hypothetical protein [Photobacterium phosphoreum]MCD9502264.1 hypothetical protein [Photobacterium phosphoreum]MCD9512487.1 hypothetical protein [Photobacterium phosphoreum]
MSNSIQKLFIYSFTTQSNKKFVVAVNENEQVKNFSVGSGDKIMAYVMVVESSSEIITNADLVKTTGNLLNKTIEAINTGGKTDCLALISLNYISNANHLFTATTDQSIEFNTQSLWHNCSDDFKTKMIKLITYWDESYPILAN